MSQIDVSIKLRPIRFLFLVYPSDSISLLKIFKINTCLWGGMYNPIIPYFKKVPNWWNRKLKSYYTARKILNYNFEFFEPDFVVEANQGMAESLGLSKNITLQLDDLIAPADRFSRKGYGLNVFELYKHMYQKEFKFLRRHEHRILYVKPENKKFKIFCSCVFGSFPSQERLRYINNGFQDAFDPKQIILNPSQLSSLYNKNFASALKVGCEKLEIHHSGYHDPTLFLLNATDPRDLIDYWNLRIIEKNVLAIPIQWIDKLSDFCKEFILKNHRPLPGNPHGVMIHTTIQMPRSISEEEGKKIYERHLKLDKKGAAGIRFWYPSFWKPPSEIVVGYSRPTIESSSKRVKCEISDPNNFISFDSLHPEFAEDYGNRYRWANVIDLENRFFNDDIAVVYPNNLYDTTFPNFSSGLDHTLTTTEGFVVFPRYKNLGGYWHLQDGTTAIIQWLEKKNIKSEISTPGKYVLQVVKALGGLNNLASIANIKIINLLNKMAQKQIESNHQKNNKLPPKHYSGNTVQYSELKRLMYEINKDIPWANFSIERLISGNVIKLGIEVKCNECDHWNWFFIDTINYELNCESCLSSFTFPISNPTNRAIRWAYRAVGPFSNPDYAGGAYSTAFSLRFFKHLLGYDNTRITWATSLNMQFESGKKIEIDFLFWYQRERTFNRNYKPILVFGESKSFGNKSFKKKDISRLKRIANKISGSVFVFSTMKERLSRTEKKLIQPFALWGREFNEYGESRAPVIVLTAKELFARHNLSIEWKELGGKHASLIDPAHIRFENLRVLANLTQNLYLDLDSYENWWLKKIEKRTEKKHKKM